MTPDLFSWEPAPKPPFQAHSEPSRAAAEKIKGKVGPLHERLLAALKNAPDGLTDQQMQELASMDPSTQRPRRVELVRAGKIKDSGETRPTRTGRMAAIWVLI